MQYLLISAVALLSLANGANDNFKGVATLWGSGVTSYRRALAWATAFTFLGSITAALIGGSLAAKFNGSTLVAKDIYTRLPFDCAIVLAAAGTVLLASRLGLPVSTTHALVGSLIGAGVTASGIANVHFAALGSSVILPLFLSPVAALLLTILLHPLVRRLTNGQDCICIDERVRLTATLPGITSGAALADATSAPEFRLADPAECQTGAEVVRFRVSEAVHWLSGAAISFGRALNDTPKIVAVLSVVETTTSTRNAVLVAAVMAVGGLLGAARVAQTMGRKITPMATPEAVTANLVAASLTLLASHLALPVSTTHVTTGGIFGISLLRLREADWRRVRDIVFSWLLTLPMGAALAGALYWLLARH